MTKSERAQELMAKGPVWLVRRVMELEGKEIEAMVRNQYGEVLTVWRDGSGLLILRHSDFEGRADFEVASVLAGQSDLILNGDERAWLAGVFMLVPGAEVDDDDDYWTPAPVEEAPAYWCRGSEVIHRELNCPHLQHVGQGSPSGHSALLEPGQRWCKRCG